MITKFNGEMKLEITVSVDYRFPDIEIERVYVGTVDVTDSLEREEIWELEEWVRSNPPDLRDLI